MNVCFLFVRLQLYREVKCVYNTVLASHIDTSVLTDGTYELIPDSEGGDPEAPDQISEEPRAEIVSDYREGKPRT